MTTDSEPIESGGYDDNQVEATLRFKLPENREEFLCAIHGQNFHGTMWEIDQQMRDWLKYGTKMTARQVAEWVRDKLSDEIYRIYD